MIVGTRPEAIKLVPIILALQESSSLVPIVVSTGQHHRMVEQIFDLAGIRPDATLLAGGHRARLNERVSTVMRRFEDFVSEVFGEEPEEGHRLEAAMRGDYPVAVAVHGDTSSAMAAALAAFHLHIPVVHVEAGLRTGGNNLTPFPEELNRQVITCIAALHLAPTATNLQNLLHENVPVGQVFVCGNTGVDAMHWAAGLEVPFRDPAIRAIVDDPGRIVVVTAHRRENWGEGLERIAAGVGRVAEGHPDVHFVVPMHPNPSVREQLSGVLAGRENVLLTEPMAYAEFAHLLSRCHLVITDSGGIQEEAPSLGKPVLVARETTERVEGVVAGTLLVVGTDSDRIAYEADRLLRDDSAYARMAAARNPYGDGRAAERIVGALEYIGSGQDPPTSFGHGFSRQTLIRAAGGDVAAGPIEELEQRLHAANEAERVEEEERLEAAADQATDATDLRLGTRVAGDQP